MTWMARCRGLTPPAFCGGRRSAHRRPACSPRRCRTGRDRPRRSPPPGAPDCRNSSRRRAGARWARRNHRPRDRPRCRPCRRREGGVGGDQDGGAAVLPLLPGVIVVSVGVAEVVQVLDVDAHTLAQIRIHEGRHGAHVVDAGQLVVQPEIIAELGHHLAVDHGCAHAAEIHGHPVRFLMCKCSQNPLWMSCLLPPLSASMSGCAIMPSTNSRLF